MFRRDVENRRQLRLVYESANTGAQPHRRTEYEIHADDAHATRHGDYQINNWSPEDFKAHIAFMHTFNKASRSRRMGRRPGTHAARAGELVRAGKNGAPVTDGVFPESKEFSPDSGS